MKLNIDEYSMELGKIDKLKGKFVNRDLSWIKFNERVLACALKSKTPMNERLNFLGITESNLDEFISVRFANAYHDKKKEPYKELLKKIKEFKDEQNKGFISLTTYMKKNYGYEIVLPENLNKKEKDKLSEVFETSIFPLLTPIDICSNDINISSGVNHIAIISKRTGKEKVSIIPVIKSLEPIYVIGKKILLIEDIILYFLSSKIFINQEICSTGVFKIIKDASIILSHDDSKFIVDRMNDTINKRNNAKPIFMMMRKNKDERVESILSSLFKVPSSHIYTSNIVNDYKVFSRCKIFDNEDFNKFEPFIYENYDNYYNIFDAIDHEDILLHHPYDSYYTVIKFLEHAANDPDVETIKQTLYRVSGIDSPIVNALCTAAKHGKFVTVLVEIKARFDEENNIMLIDKLKKSGVHVILGDEFLKTHCKLCIVTKRVNDEIKVYSHVATGNYNEKTAKIYTDLSYLTSKQKIGIDLLQIFNILSGHSRPDESLDKVYYAPINLRKKLKSCIDREIENVKKGKSGEIFIKVNSISDVDMVNKLYEAAKAGVKVSIICRGICSIIPIKNMKVKSIVGRFLEHSRIYYFKNGKSPEYYISSADLLTRNLDRRVETLISLKDSNVIKQISWIRSVLEEDEANSFILKENGKWEQMEGTFDAHQWMIEYSDIKKQKKSWK